MQSVEPHYLELPTMLKSNDHLHNYAFLVTLLFAIWNSKHVKLDVDAFSISVASRGRSNLHSCEALLSHSN